MTLPPQVQTLVDQIVQAIGLHATRPSALEINLDAQGIVQDVKPKLVYRRGKMSDSRLTIIHVVLLTDGRYVNAISGHEVAASDLGKYEVINPGRPITWGEHCAADAARIDKRCAVRY